MWRLSRITLNNFRVYKGKNVIEFSIDENKRITIIVGANGTGKTTLLNAITWCLYGKEHHIGKKGVSGEEKFPILNAKIGESVAEVAVKLEFTHTKNNSQFFIERKQKFERIGDKMEAIPDELKILYKPSNSSDWKIEHNPKYFIQTLLPNMLHDFYFFDGERLDNLLRTKEDSTKNIKESIERLSYIDLIETTINHLDYIRKDIYKDINSRKQHQSIDYYSQRINSLQQEIIEIGKDIEYKKKELEDLEKNIKKLKDKIDHINEKLNEYREIGQYMKERERLEKTKEEEEKELEYYERQFSELLVTKAIYIYCEDAISKFSNYIENMYKEHKLPPAINPIIIEDIITKDVCICGRSLGDNERARLNDILNKLKPDYELFDLLKDEPTKDFYNTIEEFRKKREEYKNKIIKLQNSIKEKVRELKEISDKLINMPQEDVKALETERKKCEDELINLSVYKRSIETRLEHLKKEKDEKMKELDEEIKNSKKYKKEAYKLDLINKAFEELKKMKEERKKEIKKKVSEMTDRFFKQLIWKKDSFKEVVIDDKYNISVYDNEGRDRLTVLSAGEREILALSYIAAIRQIINIDMPIIIDTPLARISSENRKNLLELFPKYLEDTQMILLMTDKEYGKDEKGILNNYVGKELLLEFDRKEQSTRVRVMKDDQQKVSTA